MKKYIITGGTCAGKTALSIELERRGNFVTGEAASKIRLEEEIIPASVYYNDGLRNYLKGFTDKTEEVQDHTGIIWQVVRNRGTNEPLGLIKGVIGVNAGK